MDDNRFPSSALGSARLEPSAPVIAAETGTWTLVYTTGSLGIDEGGTIKIAHRFASDWEPPQFDQPTASGYTTVRTTGRAVLKARYESKGSIRPYRKALSIDVSGHALKPGDEVIVTFGDRSHGSPGMRAQTFQESAHEFRVCVDPTNSALARPLACSPTVPVVPGPAVKGVCLLPTRAEPGRWIEIFLRGEDAWGNPAPAPPFSLRWEGDGEAELEGTRLRLHGEGTGWVIAESALGIARSNPIRVCRETTGRFWADLHAQTGSTIGTGTEEEYFAFGRDVARLDIISHQGNDFQISDALWASLNETTRRFHEEGRYVVFPGYEWSGNTPVGGDHNVFYREEGLPIFRSSHWLVPDAAETPGTPAPDLDTLLANLRREVPEEKVIVASHVGGRYAEMRRPLDVGLAPLVEVVSCWGIFEWMLWDSFEQGHVVGVMANSDGHKGRPGCEGPGAGEFGIGGGLTCVLAESLTREAVFEALRQRRCYGTTGARMDLSFSVNGAPMGSVLPPSDLYRVEARVATVAPLEELALYAGRERLHVFRPREFETVADSPRVRVQWGGAEMRGRSRRIRWDGRVTVSGNRIARIAATAFDSPADGIVTQTADSITFRSATTGDRDSFDIELEEGRRGTLLLETERGSCEVRLSTLGDEPVRRECGGLDAFMAVGRYPLEMTTRQAAFELRLAAEEVGGRPLLIRVLQGDGHLAWASPVYIRP